MPMANSPPAFARSGFAHPSSNLEIAERCALITEPQDGMNLRDYFAAKALVGFQAFVRGGWSGEMPAEMTKHIAENCYAIADTMLAQREK